MKYLNYFLLLIVISCSQGEVRKNFLDSAYRTSGIEQFIIPELPAWANSSASGGCFKKHSFQYLDFSKLGVIHDLKYSELIELQAQFNDKLENYYRSTSQRFVKPIEEASFFSNAMESVKGGVKDLKVPSLVKKINVIWLDRYLLMSKESEIKVMDQDGIFSDAYPILFSVCMSKQDMQQWIIENNLEQIGFGIVSAEWLSPFGADLRLQPGLSIELKNMVKEEVEFTLLSPDNSPLPYELKL